MANLNIPFVLLQPSQCEFKPSLATTKLISYHSYNINPQSQLHSTNNFSSLMQSSLSQSSMMFESQPNLGNGLDQNKKSQSDLDDTLKNLIVVGDSQSGTIALFHQEQYVSKKGVSQDSHSKAVSKFIVSLFPRVLLVPSISEEVGPVLDYTLVRSPAQHVLSSSSHFLVSLHSDNRIRLWNTNDGRCIMTSARDLLVTKATQIKKIKSHPGHILVMGKEGDIYIVNVYIMSILKHFMYEFQGCVKCVYKNKYFVLFDTIGKIFIFRDESQPTPIKNMQTIENRSMLLELCNNEDQEAFQFELDTVLANDNTQQEFLSFYFANADLIVSVGSKRIDLIKNKSAKTEYVFDVPLVFAKFVTYQERELLLCIDKHLNLMIFDAMKLKYEGTKHEPIAELNLISDSRFFDISNIKVDNPLLNDKEELKQQFIKDLQQALQRILDNKEKAFRYNPQENLLYSVIELKGNSKMLSWSLEVIIENLNYPQGIHEQQIPLFVNNMALFQKQTSNCLINFNSLIIKNYHNKLQFQFFFSDEVATESVVYTSSDHPSLIIGTNYGRIFIISMFQEIDEKVFPVVLVDTHHHSPITKLFVTYNSSRHYRYNRSNKHHLHPNVGVGMTNETGGHLISVSEDGTIAITNLNSSEMHKQLHNFSINERERRKADTFMQERNMNQRERRRNSIHQHFTVNQYYYLVKAKPQKVYEYSTFRTITKIIEVKSLHMLQEKIYAKMHSQYKRNVDKKLDQEDDHLLNQELHSPLYACIGEDGQALVFKITNQDVHLFRYMNMDSEAIGAYQDEDLSQIYFLTEKLSFYSFNKHSQALERKSDYKYAINTLQIKESVDYILSKNESFKIQSQHDSNIFDYYTFEKIFKKKSLLMGLGSHKTLDFLSLSLNLPLVYHPHTPYSNKYSKSLHNLLSKKAQFNDFSKKEEAMKQVLKALNDTFFLNNRLYKSDFNEYYFDRQTGVTTLQTEATFCRSKQQMIIINTKRLIHVMRSKMNRATQSMRKTNRFQDDDHQQHNHYDEEEEKLSMPGDLASQKKSMKDPDYRLEGENLTKVQWPTRLLSLIHPFNIDENVDVMLEQFFGLNLPFLDFRIGVQGADESFSFVISKEDEDFHSDRQNVQKILRLLRMSHKQRHYDQDLKQSKEGIKIEMIKVGLDQFQKDLDKSLEPEPLGRFFNSEYWKISTYLSTIMPTMFLSVFVSIVEFSQQDVKFLLQEWLYILQRINHHRTLHGENSISMSVISKILLKKNHNISSTARDVIMKPILYTLDMDHLKEVIDEWQAIIMDTYNKLRKESNVKKQYGSSSRAESQSSSAMNSLAQSIGAKFNGLGNSQASTLAQSQASDVHQINQYFGELEIRGLINLSYFTLYYSQNVDSMIQYRVSKITTILTREIVQKFNNDKKYIHLLTILLQLLSTWMKTQSLNSKSKIIIDQVIKLLLILFNFYKSPLNKEQFITRIYAENFHLIRPTHSELYLKLTAAKALLEIGENFTHDFLMIIQEQATTLSEGAEYQQNVLEILRYFINGYGENLEHHLIQLTQILLKCLDPNDLALRKNSHKLISVILSIMVKIFPMVAFHHDSQRLAVGTHDGPIAIYDVRTSAKWKILEGHTGNVTCLTFDQKGNMLASYSAIDLTVRLWKVGNTGFFSTIMGGTGKCSREMKLNPIPNAKNPHHIIQLQRSQTLQGQLKQSAMNQQNINSIIGEQDRGMLGGQGDGTRINKCSIQFIKPKEKEVELIREDGSKEVLKLVK